MQEKDLIRKKNLKRLFIIGLCMFAIGFLLQIILAMILDLSINNKILYLLHVMEDLGVLVIALFVAGKASLREMYQSVDRPLEIMYKLQLPVDKLKRQLGVAQPQKMLYFTYRSITFIQRRCKKSVLQNIGSLL